MEAQEITTPNDLTALGVSDATAVAAAKMADTFNNLTKDLPEMAKLALASAIVGGALVAAGVVLAKKL